MKNLQYIFLLPFIITPPTECENKNIELISVVVLFRHGDRTIRENSYPNDPYRSQVYWPDGFGQLTNKGRRRQYELGLWLRSRYDRFLSKLNLKEDVYVLSSNLTRTIQSVQNNLAGLFPVDKGKGQPPSIDIVPYECDNFLLFHKTCPRHTRFLDQLKNSSQFLEINKNNIELYEYLSTHLGTAVVNVLDVARHYKTLLIESENNFTLPSWTKSVFPAKLKPLAGLAFSLSTFNSELARLKVGLLVNKIAEQFEVENVSKKFTLYSAHDVTVAALLNALGIFEHHFPPYAATVILELREINKERYVNIFYKQNGTLPQKKILGNCEFDCPLHKFLDVVHPIRLTPNQWEAECIIES